MNIYKHHETLGWQPSGQGLFVFMQTIIGRLNKHVGKGQGSGLMYPSKGESFFIHSTF